MKVSVIVFLIIFIAASAFSSVDSKVEVDKKTVKAKVSKLQMPFIENKGQIKDQSVKFYADTFAGTVSVTGKGEIVYNLTKPEQRQTNDKQSLPNSKHQHQKTTFKTLALRETLEGSLQAYLNGMNRSTTKVNYFKGPENNWRTNISTWQEVSMGEVYPGINLKLRAYGNNVEKLFYVKPGSKPEGIKVKLSGAQALKIADTGELTAETDLGTVKFTKPVAYQEIDGKKVEVVANYYFPDMKTSTADSGRVYSFRLGDYDKTKEVVIDPLLYSTYLGGSGSDFGAGIVDSIGNIYVAGVTMSPDFPTTTGVFDGSFNGGDTDFFILKISPSFELVYSTFIGGSGTDYDPYSGEPYASGMAVDVSGNVYATGETSSNDFPTTNSAFDRTINGASDAFITKLSSDGDTLIYSTFLGGIGNDVGAGIAVDTLGNAYVAGTTGSSNFPTTSGAYDRTYNGDSSDIFVAKIAPTGSSLIYSTFIGGSSWDEATEMGIDGSGNAYIVGGGDSTDYPTTAGAYDRTGDNTIYDIYLTKLNATGSGIIASTFLGGNNKDWAEGIATDNNGNIFISGDTYSTDFPTTTGAYDRTYGGPHGGFISKFDSGLSQLLASTFFVGFPPSIGTDSSGNVYIGGMTASSNFPTTPGAYDTTFHGGVSNGGVLIDDFCSPLGGCDAFVSKLDNNLTTLLASTFFFFFGNDAAGIALGPTGNVYVIGMTTSNDFPVKNAFDSSHNGSEDVFIAVLDKNLSSFIPVPTSQQGFSYSAVNSPVFSSDPAQAKPVGIGSVAVGSDTLSIQIGLNEFSGPVDIYGAFTVSADPLHVNILNPDGTSFTSFTISDIMNALSTGVPPAVAEPWKANTVGPMNEDLFDMPVSSIPSGTYTVYLLATPAGSLSSYYLWITSFVIP